VDDQCQLFHKMVISDPKDATFLWIGPWDHEKAQKNIGYAIVEDLNFKGVLMKARGEKVGEEIFKKCPPLSLKHFEHYFYTEVKNK